MKSAAHKAKQGMEICGLLIQRNSQLFLLPVKNSTTEMGSYEIWPRWEQYAFKSRAASNMAAAKREVVGTYHSHPLSPAEPGTGDILGTYPGAVMLIISCWDKNACLWRIRKGKATRLILCSRPIQKRLYIPVNREAGIQDF